ncbi:NERD domain-containing protein [Priestia flexa]|uniref:NERD domain-containing protein n=1 Tax=Priestia flexa TaxID=86664 RepID=UPI00095436F4|nr:NERD domain-containing protein [Priestia flexa]MBY6088299.1 NERD domain-containing protein [Priestia flexa]SIR20130.1 Nuclease-related domain-containing protein [Priestia flexa]
MAQLIKIQDYLSRYERDLYHYSSQFTRVKQHNWEKAKDYFYNGEEEVQLDDIDESPTSEPSLFRKVKSFFKKDEVAETDKEYMEVEIEKEAEENFDAENLTAFVTEPKSLQDLKVLFLENVFQMQMRWATSTLFELSNADKRYFYDEKLQYFLKSFPDTFLLMYKPVFLVKKAPVEAEVILITPTETICIAMVEGKNGSVFQYSKENFWTELIGKDKKKVLNPVLGLNRTEQLVKSLYQSHNIDRPIRKILLSRNGFFDSPTEPYQIDFIDKRNYEEWFYNLRRLSAPLKFNQLQAAEAILKHSQSIYFDRSENE